MAHKVAIIGAGSWGTTYATLVQDKVDEVVLWAHWRCIDAR